MSKQASKKNTPKKNNNVIEEEKDDNNNGAEVYEDLLDRQSSIEAAQNYLDKVSHCINTNIVSLLWTLSELWPYYRDKVDPTNMTHSCPWTTIKWVVMMTMINPWSLTKR